MTSKTTIAPTVELATPRVKAFAEKLRTFFSLSAEIKNFYTCDPSTLDIEDRKGNRWTEGSWGLELLTDGFNPSYLPDMNKLSASIEISDIFVQPYDKKRVVLSIWLTAKVFRG